MKIKIDNSGAFYIKGVDGHFIRMDGLCYEECDVHNTRLNTTMTDMYCVEACSGALPGEGYAIIGVLKNEIITKMLLEWVWAQMKCCNHFIDIREWEAAEKGFVSTKDCTILLHNGSEDEQQ